MNDQVKKIVNLSPKKQEALLKLLRKGSEPPSVQISPRKSQSDCLPLSFAQQRLWFLHQWAPSIPFYNISVALRLEGKLNTAILHNSLIVLIQRHEILRTHFAFSQQLPVQRLMPSIPFLFPLIDLSQLETIQREQSVYDLMQQEEQVPFDLSRCPLLRLCLLRLEEHTHILLLTMHHIISDGWSVKVLFEELAQVYSASVQDRPPALPALPIQYADYALWQREWLQGARLEQQLAYWRKQLAGVPVLHLPTDHPRPPMQRFRGANQGMLLPATVSAQVQALSQQEQVTQFMTLLAAFQVLLAHYSGQQDIVVGSPVAGRTHAEVERLIGFFVNTLVLRTDLSGNPTFRQVLQRVREVCLGAYAHQDVPFEKLVEVLQPDRDLSRSPFFQVTFVLQNIPTPTVPWADLRATWLPTSTTTARFDISLLVYETPEGLLALAEYNTDLFEKETIARLLKHWQTLLCSLLEQPEQPVWQARWLTQEEQDQLLQWNATQQPYPHHLCIHQLMDEQTECTPEAIALVCHDRQFTYRFIQQQASRLAGWLNKLGIGPEVCVGLCVERNEYMIIGLLSILKAGGAYVPLDPSYPFERLNFMLQDAQVPVVLTQRKLGSLLIGCKSSIINLDENGWQTAGQQEKSEFEKVTSHNLAYIIYTSGSTGIPKGVLLEHKGLCNIADVQRSIFNVQPDDRLLQFSSISFDASLFEIVMALRAGATLCMGTPDALLPGIPLTEFLHEQAITTVTLPPSALTTMAPGSCSTLETIVSAGEACTKEIVAQWAPGRRFFNAYGPSEATIWATVARCNENAPEPFIGHPIANTQVYVLDRFMFPVPSGVVGELYLGGVGLARGYLHQPELTAESFVPHPFSSQEGSRLYRTGDLGCYLPDGTLLFMGRKDQQVKLRGYRIELGEIEAVLVSHTAVKEAAVVCQQTSLDRRLLAYIVVDPSSEIDVASLRAWLQERLPAYMIPSAFISLPHFPLTPNGKLDRRALLSLLPLPAEGTYTAPRTPLEELLCGIWQQILRVDRIGIYDNFFELGGHSLLVTQVLAHLRSILHIELPVRIFFENPTVSALAHQIELIQFDVPEPHKPPLERASRSELLFLSFAQKRLWFLQQWAPESHFCNIPVSVRLTGNLRVEKLAFCMAELVRRHAVLRTSFVLELDEPTQRIAEDVRLKFPLVDLSDLERDEKEQWLRYLVQQEAQQPFDLSRCPLLRLCLLRLEEHTHILLLTMHHIISDGWSVKVLFEELAQVYSASVQDRPPALPALPIQYADYALWQREWLQGARLEQQLAYWRKQLAGVPVLHLPTDHPRPPMQRFHGANQGMLLPATVSAQVQALSQQEQVTQFMTLLAAFQVLLAHYSGQQDIVVGSPVAGRTHAEVERLIGFFVNTLVLRTDLSGNPTFRQVLQRVREVCLGAYAHQDVPFEKLVEVLRPQRDTSYSPLCQVNFTLQHRSQTSIHLPDLSLEWLAVPTTAVKFDIRCVLQEDSEGLWTFIEYDTDLFEPATIEKFLKHWHLLLESIIADPGQSLTSLQRHISDG